MVNRCLNNLFGYCSGTPKGTTKTDDVIVCGEPDPIKIEEGTERTTEDGKYIVEARISPACKLDINSCKHYQKEPNAVV